MSVGDQDRRMILLNPRIAGLSAYREENVLAPLVAAENAAELWETLEGNCPGSG